MLIVIKHCAIFTTSISGHPLLKKVPNPRTEICSVPVDKQKAYMYRVSRVISNICEAGELQELK